MSNPHSISMDEFEKLFVPPMEKDVHLVWHEFVNHFKEQVMFDDSQFPVERWKLIGYDLMKAVEPWAKGWPDDVQIVRCDDNIHTSSQLVIIQHRTRDNSVYHGTTIVFIPQNDGDPSVMFLYEHHLNSLADALSNIKLKQQN
jgi:hypothetical protein